MKVNTGPVVVQSFHYDLVDPKSEPKTDIQVQVQDYPVADGEELSGKMVQILAPFNVHPAQAEFAVSGLIGQVFQLPDFTGELSDITPEMVAQLSQPMIEQIQTITYQVTALTLEHGYHLDFQADFGAGEIQDN